MRRATGRFVFAVGLIVGARAFGADSGHVPGASWESRPPQSLGVDGAALARFAEFTGGRGVVVRQGYLVHTWGDAAERGDVASAVKPLFTHFLFRAVREGRLTSLDESVLRWEPRLGDIDADLGFKDRGITWRHFATQTSCYGLRESPGSAFAYSDWQMALFVDLLFPRVYGVSWSDVDAKLLLPFLRDALGCEDAPSWTTYARGQQPGRLVISPRDFARFGLLYSREGRWGDRTLVPAEDVRRALRSPLPASLPRAGTNAAAMLPDQRTLGSRRIPDNQTEHFGSYSFLWWINGIQADGRRHWPDAPTNMFAALGHGGIRGLAGFPDLDLVVSWNDARIDSPEKENEAFRRLVASVVASSTDPTRSLTPVAAGSSRNDPRPGTGGVPASRLRVVIETDAGGDPDDEQSLVRFLLFANEWEVEGLIANRPRCRDRENLNPERTGLGVVRRLVDAYGACWTNLVRHDSRYPSPEVLRERTVAGYDDTDAAVELLIAIVDRADPRPVWYSDWGSDRGSATNNLRRALDRVRRERGAEGYARFKSKLRLSSVDQFAEHTRGLAPAFALWVDPWHPEQDGRRWYHRFSALTATAGGFDLVRDVIRQGPLGALYPTNTTPWAKEGDSLSFLYLVPNGLNAPEHPGWGGWGGRLAPMDSDAGSGGARSRGEPARVESTSSRLPSDPSPIPRWPYFHATVADSWQGVTHRDNTLLRWAADLQNDFRARLRWTVTSPTNANHPPVVRFARLAGGEEVGTLRVESGRPLEIPLASGATAKFSVGDSRDPDGDPLTFEWIVYPEAGTWRGSLSFVARGPELEVTAPRRVGPETIHFVARVSDSGAPPLTRYQRVVWVVVPEPGAPRDARRAAEVARYTSPPPEIGDDQGPFRPVLRFYDGRPVVTAADWAERRREILNHWRDVLGPWPAPLSHATIEVVGREGRENFEQRRVRVQVAADRWAEGWLLVPFGPGPFPAVFVPFYEPESSIGRGARPMRDFASRLARRGFVTLALGSPGGDARRPDTGSAVCQPLAFLAHVAENAATALAGLPEVDPARLGIVGHSYGGKWAMFGACLSERYACGVWSDPGIVWDESRANVNYWEAWYLGREIEDLRVRPPRASGVPSDANPRTGAYARLVQEGCDLHELMALMAPRPFLVSGGAEDSPERWRALNHVRAVNRLFGFEDRVAMTSRPTHELDEESHAAIVAFFQAWLGSPPR